MLRCRCLVIHDGLTARREVFNGDIDDVPTTVENCELVLCLVGPGIDVGDLVSLVFRWGKRSRVGPAADDAPTTIAVSTRMIFRKDRICRAPFYLTRGPMKLFLTPAFMGNLWGSKLSSKA